MSEFHAKQYSAEEASKLIADAFDPTKVQIFCGKHNYYGPKRSVGNLQLAGSIAPTMGCPQCWFVYYFYDIANTPPSLRQERLEELEECVNHAVELEEKGQFDLMVNDTPDISIEKGAA